MAKTKAARLSLTLPNSVQPPGTITFSPTSGGNNVSVMSDTSRPDREIAKEVTNHGEESIVGTPSQRGTKPFTGTRHNTILAAPLASPTSPTSPRSPTFTSLPPFPSSPQGTPRHGRDPSRSFFANLKASKSSVKIQSPETTTIRKVPQESSDDLPFRRKKSLPNLGTSLSVSAPVMSLPDKHAISASVTNSDNPPARQSTAAPSSSTTSTSDTVEISEARKKDGSIFSNLMKRNHSGRNEDGGQHSKPSTPTLSKGLDSMDRMPMPRNSSTNRNPSPHSDPGVSESWSENGTRIMGPQLNNQRSQVFRDGGSNILHGFKKKTAKAAGGIGKAGNYLFRTTKAPDKVHEPPLNYQCTVITQPLIAQTRITRIARRLEDSKDKTEFWMPALPWRCIDYLNFKGCEVEGLYRIPGSDIQIRHWKWRFDTEYDIDLFEAEDLYDVNTIGSLFKAWLRDIPDEIFPKATQDKITEEAGQVEMAPQVLKDELSSLPPWNYYLLFAITCHLSLLHAYVDKNKMTYQNLFICFAPALKMNGDCFRWLVCDWRNCWQGCRTEKDYLEEEYRVLDASSVEPSPVDDGAEIRLQSSENRSLSSAGSASATNRPAALELFHLRDENRPHTNSNSNHTRTASQLPELSLPQPISPFYNNEHLD